VKRATGPQESEWESSEYSARLQCAGIREWFNLKATTKDNAAEKAAEISRYLHEHGWEATREKYKPKPAKDSNTVTIGEYVDAVDTLGTLHTRTLKEYHRCLRTIAAHCVGIKDRKGTRYNRTNEWQEKVDGIPLRSVTPKKAQKWQTEHLAQGKGQPENRRLSINRSCNKVLRNAKSLFSKKILKHAGFNVSLPKFTGRQGDNILWFEEIQFAEEGSKQFHNNTQLTYGNIIAAARREFRANEPDAYLLLLLTLCAGLRRGEADALTWDDININDCTIYVATSSSGRTKSGSSCKAVVVAPQLIKELLAFKARASTPYVVQSDRDAQEKAWGYSYRC
jgi:integrase